MGCMLKVGLVQMSCSLDPAQNVEKAILMIRDAASQGAQIVCLQELFTTVYFCQVEDHKYFRFAEPIPGPVTERLAAVAKETGVVIVGSLFERRAAGLYNHTSVIVNADG